MVWCWESEKTIIENGHVGYQQGYDSYTKLYGPFMPITGPLILIKRSGIEKETNS